MMQAKLDANALASLELPDDSGTNVPLGELWREGSVVLVWLRHYG